MPIILRGKVFKLDCRKENDSYTFRCLYLVEVGDLASPMWTENAEYAPSLVWEEAETIAKQLNAHPLAVAFAPTSTPQPPEEVTRWDHNHRNLRAPSKKTAASYREQ